VRIVLSKWKVNKLTPFRGVGIILQAFQVGSR